MGRGELEGQAVSTATTRWHAEELIGKYRLVSHLGSGAFGEVWKAEHKDSSDVVVALKLATQPEFARFLKKEGVLQFNLVHPGIVQVRHFDLDADPPILVMEYVDGEDLRALLKASGRLPVDEATRIFRALVEIMAYAHGQGVLHLDLKPENVLVAQDGTIKLTDFGLGRLWEQSQQSIQLSMASTGADQLSGTLAYMSKEQREGADLDHRADIYALGIMLFELLCGERPDFGDLPSRLVAEVPPELDTIFRKCVCRIDERYDAVGSILEKLPDATRLPVLDPATLPAARLPHCSACAASVHDDWRFCIRCGFPIIHP